MDYREQKIVEYLQNSDVLSSKEIFDRISPDYSYPTLKRVLNGLMSQNYIVSIGKGKGTKYKIAPIYEFIYPIDIEKYFLDEIDNRKIKETFDTEFINKVLINHNVFSKNELNKLNDLQEIFQQNIKGLTEIEYQKELERLAIDLSWKSSQIEGNTYSLLETERLLKEKETASGRTKEEAVMLLNHKETIDYFIVENKNYLNPLTVSKIEDIHGVLIKELGVEKNLRKRRVGISGTNYRPLDNEYQIREALENTCKLINLKGNTYEKSLLALVLISYIQPFMDGNKRTARIVSNALLMSENHCPLSFRTVDSIDYKMAMLLFYEQNNISAMKDIFISQSEFAVNTYF